MAHSAMSAAARERARCHQRGQYQRGSKPQHPHGCLHRAKSPWAGCGDRPACGP